MIIDLKDYDPSVYTGNASLDAAALAWAVTTVGDHGLIELDPGSTLTLASRVQLSRPLTLKTKHGGRASIVCTAGAGFDVVGEMVAIDSVRAVGPTNIGLDNNSNLVWCQASHFCFSNSHVTGFSNVVLARPTDADAGAGLRLTDIRVDKIYSVDAGYAGVLLSSTEDSTVTNCTFVDVTGDTGTGQLLAYGATATSKVGHPYSRNIAFTNNIMRNIPWEGLDSHGGRNITFADNIIEGCYQGIVVTKTGDNKASHNITISNNVVDSLALGDQNMPGVIVSGVDATTPAEVATVTGNTVAGFRFGIQVRNADSVSVTGNVIKEPRSAGVRFRDYAAGGVAVGNVVIDPYGQFFSDAGSAVRLDTSDPIVVVGNTLRRPGGATAAAAANYGEHLVTGDVVTYSPVAVVVGNDGSEANTSPVRDQVNAVEGSEQWGESQGTFTGDGTTVQFDLVHNLGKGAVAIALHNVTTNEVNPPGGPGITYLDDNTTRLTYATAPTAGHVYNWSAT